MESQKSLPNLSKAQMLRADGSMDIVNMFVKQKDKQNKKDIEIKYVIFVVKNKYVIFFSFTNVWHVFL